MSYLGHHLELQKIQFIGELKTHSPIHIGAGRNANIFEPTDLSLIKISKDGKELPYIPGSSLKGVLRSACEAIALSVTKVCNITSYRDSCFAYYRKELDWALRKKKTDKILKILNDFCLICKIFGSSSYNSKIQIRDCYPVEEITTEIKKGIAIDRRTGSASRGALYDLELIEPLNLFGFQIIFNNLPNYLIGLVAQAILEINNQNLFIGGMKSRGLGRIKIILKEIKTQYRTDEGKFIIESLLDEDFTVVLDNLKPQTTSNGFTKNVLTKFVEAWEKYASQTKK
ncbi:MAG: CRISPR-associated RAMP protein Csx7 [Promethearchaeota archaeon]